MPGQIGPRTHIGRLRHRITIQERAATADAFGQPVADWTDVASVRGDVMAVSGRELFASGGVQANVTHRVMMRHRSGLTPAQRLIWVDTGTILNIVAAPPSVGTANIIELWCLAEA